MLLYIALGFVVVVVAVIIWLYTSVARGANKRDDRIMDTIEPVATRIAEGQEVTAREIADLARQPQNRPFLYELLKHFEKLDLFPTELTVRKFQGEAQLAYWMMHPNELQDPPAEMELVATCPREIDGRTAEFLVFRYRMAEGHWAGEDWLLGLSGPFFDNDIPYSGVAGAFSRCDDKDGEVAPDELVDWFVDMVQKKSA